VPHTLASVAPYILVSEQSEVPLSALSPRWNDMTESALPPDKDHARTIGALSDKLQVPMNEVGAIYRMEFDRLARGARVHTYLAVLAMSHTQSILREGRRRAAFH
jgi:hypothetical protein